LKDNSSRPRWKMFPAVSIPSKSKIQKSSERNNLQFEETGEASAFYRARI